MPIDECHHLTPQTETGRLFTDGTSKPLVFGEKYRHCRADNIGSGNIWGHGAWTMRYMPVFAYGSRDGVTAFANCSSSSLDKPVGPESKPQPTGPAVSAEGTNTCASSRTQAIHSDSMTAGFADGSIRMIATSIDGEPLPAGTVTFLCDGGKRPVIAGPPAARSGECDGSSRDC